VFTHHCGNGYGSDLDSFAERQRMPARHAGIAPEFVFKDGHLGRSMRAQGISLGAAYSA
jgi:hypothetical protein